MSDVIEILKKIFETNKSAMFEDEKEALKKGILALKQKEKINEIIKREKYWINKILNNPKDYEKDKVSEAWFKDQLITKLEGVEK